MIIDIQITPESEDEVTLIEKLTEAREYGLTETDLSDQEIAAVFSQFAAGITMEADVEGEEHGLHCPECGTPIQDVTSRGMGMPPIVKPCGCKSEWEDIPPEYFDVDRGQ